MNKHHLRIPTAWAVCAAAVLLSACAGTVRGNQNTYESEAGAHDSEVIEGNPELARQLKIKGTKSREEADGRLTVQFELVNDLNRHIRFQWAIDWFDDQGFRVDDKSRHWEPVQLGASGFTTIRVTAPRPGVRSWSLQVSSPNEAH